MKISLETRKTFGVKNANLHRVKPNDRIYTIPPWSDNDVSKKATVEAEYKKAKAITILINSTRIR